VTDIRGAHTTDEPYSRVTRMAAWLCDQLAGHHEHLDGDRVIVMIHGGDQTGGIAYDGYETDPEAQEDMILFVKGVFEARGASFRVIHMQGGPNRPDVS
jgi:hypothetical protein